MLPHWNFCCWPPSLVSRELQTFGWGKVHHCWSGILQSMYFFMHAFIIFSASCYPFTFFLQKKNWACHHLIFPPPLIFRDMTKLNWIFLNSRVKNKSNHPPFQNNKGLFCHRGSSLLKCIPERGHKCMHEVRCHRLLIESHVKNVFPFRPPPQPSCQGFPLAVLKFLKWYGQCRCHRAHVSHERGLSPWALPCSAVTADWATDCPWAPLESFPDKTHFPPQSSSWCTSNSLVLLDWQ